MRISDAYRCYVRDQHEVRTIVVRQNRLTGDGYLWVSRWRCSRCTLRSSTEAGVRWTDTRDKVDFALARLSLRYPLVAQFCAFRGLLSDGYRIRPAWRVARGLKSPKVRR